MNNSKRVLSLITHFDHIPSWKDYVITINTIDKKWNNRNIFSRAWFVVQGIDHFNAIILHFDLRFCAIFSLLLKISFWKRQGGKLIFTTYLCDISSFDSSHNKNVLLRCYNNIRYKLHKLILSTMDCVVVHSRAEINLYSHFFKEPESKFVFIPYCVRADALNSDICSEKFDYVITAGRHRDIATFIEALKELSIKGVIIAGESDRPIVPKDLPKNIDLFFEVPFNQYRRFISQAKALIIPLSKNHTLRSLGQIAAFEAVAAKVPIVASRTFQLIDYFEEGKEILFFEPEDPLDLRKNLEILTSNPKLGKQLAENAYEKMMMNYTDKNYTNALINLIETQIECH